MQPSSTNTDLVEKPEKQKKSHQFKALFLKSATLQSKQIGTNICQILTPIICLLFTYIIKVIASDNLGAQQDQISFGIPLNPNMGAIPNASDYFNLNCLQWYEFQSSDKAKQKDYVGTNDGVSASTGLLSNIKNVFETGCGFNNSGYNNIDTREIVTHTPFFRESNGTAPNDDIAKRLTYINENDFKKTLDVLPDGAVYFEEASDSKLSAVIQINDCRTFQYHRFNGLTGIRMRENKNSSFVSYVTVPEGQLSFIDQLNSAYIKKVANVDIYAGIVYMPPTGDSNILVNSIINVVGSTIFPLALSLLFPVFLYAIVLEKEQRLIQMMKMNGMSMKNYWLVTFLFNLFLSLLTNTIFYLFGYFVVDNSFFRETPFAIMFVVLFGWMLAQIGMATFFQTFISNSRSANIIGYLLSIWTSLIATSLNVGVYQFPIELPYWLRIYAPFSFGRVFYIMLIKCSTNECLNSFSVLPDEMKHEIAYLYICFFVFQLVGMYLHEVIPQEFGVAKPLLYPYHSFKRFLKRRFRSRQDDSDKVTDDKDLRKYVSEDDEDEDSRHERIEVSRFQDYFTKYPLVCNNLRKLYKKQGRKEPFAAVRSFNLIIEPNQIFGLLGPNGAGKTTLISLITGMFEPNNGNAWVGGYSIIDEIEKVHLEMGVCPQFDLLWPEMTVEEHLYFYARLKGADRKEEALKVEQAIKQVNLEKFSKFKTTQLSGGMKRRLSVAISLVGSPRIVFLDEPTTGLDPDNRRQLWTVLAKCREKRAMFLTTHMMDEADTLCNRIGIITNGVLRTVANQIKLRKKYGGGYRLDINLSRDDLRLRESVLDQDPEINNESDQIGLSEEQMNKQEEEDIRQEIKRQADMKEKSDKLTAFIRNNFEESRLVKVFNGNFIFKLGTNIAVSEVFDLLERHKRELRIAHWGVINSSLEDVFMAVVLKFDKQELIDEPQETGAVKPEHNESLALSSDSRRKGAESVMST